MGNSVFATQQLKYLACFGVPFMVVEDTKIQSIKCVSLLLAKH